MSHPVVLLVVLLVCHYLADFCFTWKGLVRAKTDGRNAWQIAIHAGIHALLMGLCLLVACTGLKLLLLLMILEFATHFVIDVLKTWIMVRYNSFADISSKRYWVLYGADQLLHQFVVVLIWYIVIF